MMRYGIVINLDYETPSGDVVTRLYEAIKAGMIAHGFRPDGRLFTINLSGDDAGTLARKVIDELAAQKAFADKDIYTFIKDFYGFDISNITNLLLPPSSDISVTELDINEFGKR